MCVGLLISVLRDVNNIVVKRIFPSKLVMAVYQEIATWSAWAMMQEKMICEMWSRQRDRT